MSRAPFAALALSARCSALLLVFVACSGDQAEPLDLAGGPRVCAHIVDEDLGSGTQGIVQVLADDAATDAAWVLFVSDNRHYIGRIASAAEDPIDPFDLGPVAGKRRRIFADLNPGRAWLLEDGDGAPTYIYELRAGSGVVQVSGDVSEIPGGAGQGSVDRTLLAPGGKLSLLSTYQSLPGATISLYLLELSSDLEGLALWTLELPAADGDSAFAQPYLAFGQPGPASALPAVVGLERQRWQAGLAPQTDIIQLRLRWQDDAPVATYLETFDDALIHDGSAKPLASLDIGIDPRRSWQLANVLGSPTQKSFTAIDWIGASAEFASLTVPSDWERPRLVQIGATVSVLALHQGVLSGAVLDDIFLAPALEPFELDGLVDVVPAGNGHAVAETLDGRTLYLRLSCTDPE